MFAALKVRSTKYEVRRRCFVLCPSYFVLTLATAVAQQPAPSSLEVVAAAKPARRDVKQFSTQPGRIAAIEQAQIQSKLAAYVGEVLVDFGDVVKAGQPLAKLLAPEVDAEVAQKKALVEQSQAELTLTQAGLRTAAAAVAAAKAKVVQAEAAIERAQADVARWRLEYARVSQLSSSGAVTRQLADETQQKVASAEAALRESAAAVEVAKAAATQAAAESEKAVADVTAAQSRIRVAEANLASAEAQQSYLVIKSPLDGVITSRRVDPGHFVRPGGVGEGLFVVARTDKVRVYVSVPEADAGLVDVGDPVAIEVQSLRGAEISGQVTRTSFAVEPTNRTLETIIDLDNGRGRLRPGMYAIVRITLAQQAQALILPAAAIMREGDQAFCYRLIDGKATKTPVQLGIKDGNDFEVIQGITDQHIVIMNKAAALKDGQRVNVVK